MGKLVKLGIGTILALIVLLVAVLVFVVSNLDSIVERVVEDVGSDVAGVDVLVAGVEISLQQGQGAVNGLQIANPGGFDSDEAVSVKNAALTLDLDSLGGDVVVLKSVRVDGARVNFEQQGKTSNLQSILENLQNSSDSGGDTGEGAETKLIIDEFRFTNGEVTATIPALRQSRSAKIPDLVLRDIGRKSSGVSAGEAARIILEPIVRQSITAATGISREELERKARDEAGEAIDRVKRKASDKLGELLGGSKD